MRRTTALATLLLLLAGCGDTDGESTPESDVRDATEDNDGETDTEDVFDIRDLDDADEADDASDVMPDATVVNSLTCLDSSITLTFTPGSESELALAVEGASLPMAAGFLGRELDREVELTAVCDDGRLVPEGVIALTPIFELNAESPLRFNRRYFFSSPFASSIVPEGAKPSDMRVYWQPGADAPVTTPVVVNMQENLFASTIRFETELTGRFQVGVPDDSGQDESRLWTYRAVTGVSMGAMGASMLAARNPDAFDIVGPMGGPAEWVYLMHFLRNHGMGGFGLAPEFGDVGGVEATEEYEHKMSYNNWWYPTGEGSGGTFDRDSFIEIFTDLALSVGNFATYSDTSPFAAPGLSDEVLLQPAEQRCYVGATCPPDDAESTFTIASGFFDEEYNPDGTLPVITFCDGEGSRDTTIPFDRACDIDFNGVPDETNRGLYTEGCEQRRAVDITYAVDVNGNGVRDFGEPVIRNFYEPYLDVGTDELASADEPGFDALSNPDPSGDDYDYVSNPRGTEGNWLYDEGESYEDVGIDGVAGTAQLADGGYDFGEGNEQFDYNPNVANVFDTFSPRHLLDAMSTEQRGALTWYMDAGIRDLFNFAVGANQLVGAMHSLGMNVRVYDELRSIQDLSAVEADDYDFTAVDYENLGEHVYLRYGSLDADDEEICFGDGKHVGTVPQIANRLLTMLGFVTNRFPNGDRSPISTPFPLPSGTYFAPDPNTGGVMKYSIAFPPGYERTACNDGLDNDGDGLVDGFDDACPHAAALSESGEDVNYCNDGIDNDADGDADDEDSDCPGDGTSEWPVGSPYRDVHFPVVYLLHGYGQSPEDLQVTALPFSTYMAQGIWPKVILVFPDGYCGDIEVTQCTDGVDNDGDGVVDVDDEGCSESGGRAESGQRLAYCEDGVDNDRDGVADLDDGGCRSAEWNSEANCVQGNFYVNHVSYGDGMAGGPAYEDSFFSLIGHVDETYRTRAPETL
ncbi:MAG: hypothetical protein ACI82G_000022 [Bradymonadia bacterium]|jgi:hypothetical protein